MKDKQFNILCPAIAAATMLVCMVANKCQTNNNSLMCFSALHCALVCSTITAVTFYVLKYILLIFLCNTTF